MQEDERHDSFTHSITQHTTYMASVDSYVQLADKAVLFLQETSLLQEFVHRRERLLLRVMHYYSIHHLMEHSKRYSCQILVLHDQTSLELLQQLPIQKQHSISNRNALKKKKERKNHHFQNEQLRNSPTSYSRCVSWNCLL